MSIIISNFNFKIHFFNDKKIYLKNYHNLNSQKLTSDPHKNYFVAEHCRSNPKLALC